MRIKAIDKESKNINLIKLKMRRLIMKSILSLKLACPYILSEGIAFICCACLGITPFVKDTNKIPLFSKKVIDNKGNESFITTYTTDNKLNGNVIHYSKWYKIDNDKYERSIKTYNLNGIDETGIEEYVKKPNIVSDLDELFGKYINLKKETKSNISSEELNSEDIVEFVIYSIDKKNYIEELESDKENISLTIVEIILLVFIGGVVHDFKLYKMSDLKHDFVNVNMQFEDAIKILKRH